METSSAAGRRPLKSRNLVVFQRLATWLARVGATPNSISALSIVFGVVAGAVMAGTAHVAGWEVRAWWLIAAVAIQLRLLANMLDGLVAVEGGKGGPTGDLWNEAPDRISDTATLIGAGYAAGSHPLLGFAAALVAVFIAYVRALGASVGTGQIFLGPQAKPQRMFVMTLACLISAAVPTFHAQPISAVEIALWIVILGGALTAGRRGLRIAAILREKARP